MSSNEFLFENDIKWQDVGGGIKRQILGHNENIMMVRIKFEAGSIGQLHNHLHSQVTYIISGKFEVEINNNKKIMQGGDAFYAAPNIMHGVKCLESGEFIDVFNPTRKDFLQKK